jgi:predicted phage tail protein
MSTTWAWTNQKAQTAQQQSTITRNKKEIPRWTVLFLPVPCSAGGGGAAAAGGAAVAAAGGVAVAAGGAAVAAGGAAVAAGGVAVAAGGAASWLLTTANNTNRHRDTVLIVVNCSVVLLYMRKQAEKETKKRVLVHCASSYDSLFEFLTWKDW